MREKEIINKKKLQQQKELQKILNKSYTFHYLLGKIEKEKPTIGKDHTPGELCFQKFSEKTKFDCCFCNEHKYVLDFFRNVYFKKLHKEILENINVVIRSIPPYGIDYKFVKNKNITLGLFH